MPPVSHGKLARSPQQANWRTWFLAPAGFLLFVKPDCGGGGSFLLRHAVPHTRRNVIYWSIFPSALTGSASAPCFIRPLSPAPWLSALPVDRSAIQRFPKPGSTGIFTDVAPKNSGLTRFCPGHGDIGFG